jgi:predicted lipase
MLIADLMQELVTTYPEYRLTLVGHSLGGAVAALAGLDFRGRGWEPVVTTFGEPKVGNKQLAEYLDKVCLRGLGGTGFIYQMLTDSFVEIHAGYLSSRHAHQ